MIKKNLQQLLKKEGNGFVSLCPGLDIANQGATIDEAKNNLNDALEKRIALSKN